MVRMLKSEQQFLTTGLFFTLSLSRREDKVSSLYLPHLTL